jgi:DNA modification methylase
MDTNVLYYGDNLEILRKYLPDSSIDLIYLDPPFNSKATYNVLYKEQTGEPSQAQITAFEDTWHWGLESEKALQEISQNSGILYDSEVVNVCLRLFIDQGFRFEQEPEITRLANTQLRELSKR